MATTINRYPTAPVSMWQKCKELRLQYYHGLTRAKEDGKLLIGGSAGGVSVIPSGLGDFIWFGGETYGGTMGADPEFSLPCLEATEAAGFGRDLCVYFRNYLGSMLLDRYYFGGSFPRPDFFIQSHICDTHSKWYQLMMDLQGVPFFGIDMPPGPWGEDRSADRVEYFAAQLMDCIEWMERVSGREFDDEKFITGVFNEYESARLWAEICLLNQNTPAPFGQKSLLSLFVPLIVMRGKDECAQFYRDLLEEGQERVSRGIASLATERYRYLHEGIPPWHFLKVFRLMERYGAISLGSVYQFCLAGYWALDPDGIWRAPRPIKDRGIELRNREEAVRFYSDLYLSNINYQGSFFSADIKNQQTLQLVDQWYAQGVVMHLNRGCKGTGGYLMESRLALSNKGIPVVTYEGNSGDSRDFDETQVVDNLESFLESQGLDKIDYE